MTTPRMLITGGSGYLGRWVAELAAGSWDVTATYSRQPGDLRGIAWRKLDVRDRDTVESLVRELQPQVIVHTAALNPGQGADYVGVNVAGTANVAITAAEAEARLIHISSDLVFDGQRGSYTEADPPSPLTDYGQTKADGEAAVVASGAEAAIVRTSLIYGWRPTIARSAQWMIDAIDRGETLRLWADELRCPIWVESLAAAVVELAGLDHTGPINIAGDQVVSRYELGLALLRFHNIDTTSVTAVPTPPDAVRPRNCTLDMTFAKGLLDTPLPGLDEVLAAHS